MTSYVRRLSIAIALVSLLAFAAGASGKTYEVTKKGDPTPGKCKPNDCSLREAIKAANKHNGKDVVSLPGKSYELAIASTGEDRNKDGDLDITDPVTVTHPGDGRAKVDAKHRDRVFDVQLNAKSTFKKLVITGGKGFDPGPTPPRSRSVARGMVPTAEGGGIRNASDIKVISTVIKKNLSARYGGGIGVISGAGLTLVKSTITRNTSPSGEDGGAIDGDEGKIVIKKSKITSNTSGNNGGALYYFSTSPSKIINSTISKNKATEASGGGIHISGGPNLATLSVSGSTLSGNRASTSGGGVNVAGGKLKVVNSTVAGNRTGGFGGGIAGVGGAVDLNAATVVGNTANGTVSLIQAAGGGLFYQTESPGFDVENSLIALNFSGNNRNDCAGTEDFDSRGHNLISTELACNGFTKPSDLIKPNPKIGNLKDNGGPTKTIALKSGSPAIDKAKKQSAPKRDQRGHKRGDHPDIGAFER
jgi:CSLREA domain-containing protein